VSRNSAAFSITADKSVSAGVTVDKISYNSNESAALASVVTSQSMNYIQENLTALVMIGNIQSPIFTDTKAIRTLMPGDSYSFNSYWNIGINAPGTYPVTLEVKDATGTVIATGTQSLVITNVISPKTALRGQVSVDKQSLMAGEPVNVSYSVTNVGNVDIPAVTFSIQTVHVAQQTVYDTIVSQASLTMGGVLGNIVPIDTANYSAKDYLVVLRANIGGVEETLAGTYFRVEGAPTTPALFSPATGSDAVTFTPVLTISNASDPNDDRITYEFELYADSGFTNLVASSGLISEQTGTTAWTVPVDLQENSTYFWRARAYDEKLYGPWMAAASFRVNTVNDPPTAPTPTSPANGTRVDTLTPVLAVTNAADPDSADLAYNVDVALDTDFAQIVAAIKRVAGGEGSTSWHMTESLQENSWYYWRAQADDLPIEGPWSATSGFFVNTANDAPSSPLITAPADNSTVGSLAADVVVNNSADPDSAVLTYFFEIDRGLTFDSAGLIRSGGIAEGQGTTSWHAEGLLENTQYFIRAKAGDGAAESAWSQVASIFVNTTNDGPSVPVPANPSSGSGVNVSSPVLSVWNSTDPDRDVLTYEFEIYGDAVLSALAASSGGIVEAPGNTIWTVPVTLAENNAYYWRARAFDGAIASDWSVASWFLVNIANDAPGAPVLSSPTEGSTVATLNPVLVVTNAADPDSDTLTYEFEVYSGTTLLWSQAAVPQDPSGTTPVSVTTTLTDNTTYQWRARAYDGDRYGSWMTMASFTIQAAKTGIKVELEVEPETLNQTSHGNWVMVEIELPHGYHASDVDLSSIRLEGVVPAETRPYGRNKHHRDHGCEHDRAQHDHDELKVKFDRNSVIALLPTGDHVPVHVTGRIGSATFEGVDFIRVIH
jgi:hypothetical protein